MESSNVRRKIDRLLGFDAVASLIFGVLSLLAPHGLLKYLGGGFYDHNVHELLRLYGCLRIACGWILWHVRKVDDGKLRKSVCEALCACYILQTLAIARAQLTDRYTIWNWIAIVIMSILASSYGYFRIGKEGKLIKTYELPTSSILD
mmetsp:Transcript_15073/g.17342  ORF Transcript_15073/g.17342 Transcript_15073/m.17342 type:complete len:148 (-) Transcript_15073:565-1008(-)